MVKEALGKMKIGKASGPTGVVIAGNDACTDLMTDNVMPSDWKVSSIVNCFKGKGEAFEGGNYLNK